MSVLPLAYTFEVPSPAVLILIQPDPQRQCVFQLATVHCLAESSNSLISFGAITGQDGSAISFVTDGVETIKFEVINAKSGYDRVRVFLGLWMVRY